MQIDLKVKDLYWIIGHKSIMSLDSKVLLYKTIIKPIWTYGLELWGCARKWTIAIMQRSQSKILRMITNAPWYVTNQTLNEDLNVSYITEVIQAHDGCVLASKLAHRMYLTLIANK
jgi:hypothetical protein